MILSVSLIRKGQIIQVTDGVSRYAITTLGKDSLTKSVETTDGFAKSTLKTADKKHIWIDTVRGRDCTVKMYETDAEDLVTTSEALTKLGPDLTAGVVDNLNPLARFFTITADHHLTLVADKPCTVEFTILFES